MAERAKSRKRLPVVLSVEETGRLLCGLRPGPVGLVVKLLYGCGLRIHEAISLRVKDVDISGGKLEVRSGKGNKDRGLPLPKSVVEEWRAHLAWVAQVHARDRSAGLAGVYLPNAMAVKNPSAALSWPWFWCFPAKGWSKDPRAGMLERRHHVHENAVTRKLAGAKTLAGIAKHVTAHPMRH